jgi:hypothetical protein
MHNDLVAINPERNRAPLTTRSARGCPAAGNHGSETDDAGQFRPIPGATLERGMHDGAAAARGDPAAWLRGQPDAPAAASQQLAPRPLRRRAQRLVPQCPVLPDGAAISPVPPIVASALCIKPRGLLTSAQAEKVDDLKAASTEFTVMRALAMRFRGPLRGGDIELLDTWLSDAVSSGIHAMRQFAATLRRDLDAVRNPILKPWSNGQTEGQINRLKTLKRTMYGRAGTELLRARMLPLHAT